MNNEDYISAYSLKKILKEKVLPLNIEFLNFKEFCKCEVLRKIMKDNEPYRIGGRVGFHFDSEVNNEKASIYLTVTMISGGAIMGSCIEIDNYAKYTYKISKYRNNPECYLDTDSFDEKYYYNENISKYKEEFKYILEILEKGYDYFQQDIKLNDDILKIFNNSNSNFYNTDLFQILINKNLNLNIYAKKNNSYFEKVIKDHPEEILKKVFIKTSDLTPNIQKIIKANEKFNKVNDCSLSIENIYNLIDKEQERREEIQNLYYNFEKEYNNIGKEITNKTINNAYKETKHKIYSLLGNTYFNYIEFINNKEHDINKKDISTLNKDFNNIFSAIKQLKEMPHGKFIIDDNNKFSRVSGNIIITNNGKIKIKRK